MISPAKKPAASMLLKGYLACVLLGLALVLLGWSLVPTTSLLSVGGVCIVLIVYGLAGLFGFARLRSEDLRLAGIAGLLAGIIFASEIILEYALLPKDNTIWGLIEFAGVFAVLFVASVRLAYRRKSFRYGPLAGVVSAMFSSTIWLIFILLIFYMFRGSARQVLVFTAEGNYADFARSGMTDFNAFIMEDFFGAGFFHLLLVPTLAAILGMLGGLVGKGLARIKKQP
jgi:hypothetical protein